MTDATSAEKADLRAVYLEQRRALAADDLERARAAIRTVVLARQRAAGWQRVAAYLPLRTEPASVVLLAELHSRGVAVIVPTMRADRDLDWLAWREGDIVDGPSLGRAAIAAVDALLVPALAVADDGTRLGRGGGSYDRALARVGPNRPIVAVLHDNERPHHLPTAPWDRPVTAAVTPAGWEDLPVTSPVGRAAE